MGVFHDDRHFSFKSTGLLKIEALAFAARLRDHSWCLCTAFEWQDYIFVNDSIGNEPGRYRAWAVLTREPDGSLWFHEHLTFHDETPIDSIAATMERFIEGCYRNAPDSGSESVVIQPREEHGRCGFCY